MSTILFRDTYAGSSMHYEIEQRRTVSDDVTLVHLRAWLLVPQGPLMGEHKATPSLLFTRHNGGWQIAALHNTWITPPGSRIS